MPPARRSRLPAKRVGPPARDAHRLVPLEPAETGGRHLPGSLHRKPGSPSRRAPARRWKPVGVSPGHSAVTWTPWGRSSSCSASVNDVTYAGAGAVDQHVEDAAHLDPPGRPVDPAAQRQIRHQHLARGAVDLVQLAGQLAERTTVAGDDDQIVATGCQQPGDGASDT